MSYFEPKTDDDGNIIINDYGIMTLIDSTDDKTKIYASEETLAAMENGGSVIIKTYIPGAEDKEGGTGYTSSFSAIWDAVDTGNLEDGVVYVTASGSTDGGSRNQSCVIKAIDFVTENGGNINSIDAAGFSMGGQALFDIPKTLEQGGYGEYKSKTTLTFIDSADTQAVFTNSRLESYDDVKVRFIVHPGSIDKIPVVAKPLAKSGANVQVLIADTTDTNGLGAHSYTNYLTIKNMWLVTHPNYEEFTMQYYDPDTETWKEGAADWIIPSSANLGWGNDFSVWINSEASDVVATNAELIIRGVNGISSAMNDNSGLFDPKVPQLTTSNANLVVGMISAQTAYLSISNDLHHRVRDELAMITEITQNYYDMDADLANLATGLSNGHDIKIGEKQYTDLSSLVNATINTDVTFFKNFQIPFATSDEKMGCISATDIQSLMSPTGAFMSNFEAEMASTKATKNEIDGLITSIGTNNLQGQVWNAVKSNLEVLSSLEQTKYDSCDRLMNTCKTEMEKIQKFMDGHGVTEINTSELPNLKAERESVEGEIKRLEAIKPEKVMKTFEVNDEAKGKKVYKTEWTGEWVPEDPETLSSMISEATEKLNEINDKIKIIEDFIVMVTDATKAINEALQEVYNSYGAQVSDYVSGREGSYIPEYKKITANFNYLDMNGDGVQDPYAVPNSYGIPYINQDDLNIVSAMKQGFCGWTSLAMLLSGLTGEYVSPVDVYLTQKGLDDTYIYDPEKCCFFEKNADGTISDRRVDKLPAYNDRYGADLEHLGLSEDPEKLKLFTDRGITPKRISSSANDSISQVEEALKNGEVVIMQTNYHYSVIAPGENGKVAYLSSMFGVNLKQNGEYDSVEELLSHALQSGEEIKGYVSYASDSNGAIPSNSYTKYSPTSKFNTSTRVTNQTSGSNPNKPMTSQGTSGSVQNAGTAQQSTQSSQSSQSASSNASTAQTSTSGSNPNKPVGNEGTSGLSQNAGTTQQSAQPSQSSSSNISSTQTSTSGSNSNKPVGNEGTSGLSQNAGTTQQSAQPSQSSSSNASTAQTSTSESNPNKPMVSEGMSDSLQNAGTNVEQNSLAQSYGNIKVGQSIGEYNTKVGYASASYAIKGLDGKILDTSVINANNAQLGGFRVINPDGSKTFISDKNISLQDLLDQGYNMDEIAISIVNKEGIYLAWVNANDFVNIN